MLRPGGYLVYAVPTARHLYGLKQVLYKTPYENEVKQTAYEGFAFVEEREATATLTLEGESVQQLFAMTPYYWNTPADGAAPAGGLRFPDHRDRVPVSSLPQNLNRIQATRCLTGSGSFCAFYRSSASWVGVSYSSSRGTPVQLPSGSCRLALSSPVSVSGARGSTCWSESGV